MMRKSILMISALMMLTASRTSPSTSSLLASSRKWKPISSTAVIYIIRFAYGDSSVRRTHWYILSHCSWSIITTHFTSPVAIPQRQTSSRRGMFPLLRSYYWNIPFLRTESDTSSTSREISTDWSILPLIPRLRNGW